MNWLQKISQRWLETHPDYDIANHLHAAFSAVLPETDGKSWESTPDVYYIPSSTYRFDQGEGGIGSYSNFNYGGFFFMHRDRMYRLDAIITMADDPIAYMKQKGFKGMLRRAYDRELGIRAAEDLGTVEANSPAEFIEQVIGMIKADHFGDNDSDENDLFPQWPYPEGEYTNEPEDELSRIVAPRVRGYV